MPLSILPRTQVSWVVLIGHPMWQLSGGLIGLTKTWAMELGPYNIRVNALCPASVSGFRIDGVIERDALARGVTPEAVREVYQRQSSLRTFTKSEDISAMVCYLAGPSGQRISG